MIKKYTACLIHIISLTCMTYGQEKNIILQTPDSGTKTYTARDQVRFLPGYSYRAISGQSMNGKINEQLLFPTVYLNQQPNVDSRELDTKKSVGTLAGSPSVTPSGGSSYEIPITIAPGTGGIQPDISLTYNSQAGNGIAGWGFGIAGLSSVSRVPKNIYFDGNAVGIRNNSTDRYALDGMRLISISGTYGTAGTEYRTEVETFSRIYSRGSYGSNGPDYFEITAKDGTKYKYGSSSGKALYNVSGKQSVQNWLLDYIEGTNGQTIKYEYTHSNLCSYIKKITYGDNTIEFFYDNREDIIPIHFDQAKGKMDRILRKIVTKNAGQILRKYDFEYTKDLYSRLVKITETNGNNESFNPTIFNWGSFPVGMDIKSESISVKESLYESDFMKQMYASVDINGDGLDDIIGLFPYEDAALNTIAQFYIAEKTNNAVSYKPGGKVSLPPNITWEKIKFNAQGILSGNILGDGTNNALVPIYAEGTGSGTIKFYILTEKTSKLEQFTLKYSKESPEFTLGDFNNDGKSNIAIIEKGKNSSGKYEIRILNIQSSNLNSWEDNVFAVELSNHPERIFTSDFDGDGTLDMMVVTKSGYTIFWNQGGGLSSCFSNSHKTTGTDFNSTYSRIQLGDFNGDGLPDLILNEKNNANWHVFTNNGNKTFTKKKSSVLTDLNIIEEDFTAKNDHIDQCFVVDFDGDGKSDLIINDGVYKKKCNILGANCYGEFQTQKVYWLRSNGDEFELVKEVTYNESDQAKSQFFVLGDFNGDGAQELMFYGFDCSGNDKTSTGMEKKWRMYSNYGFGNSSGKITSIADGLNNKIKFNYLPLTDKSIFTKTTTAIFPVVDIQFPLYVVNKMEINPRIRGGGPTMTRSEYSYLYEGAKFHTQGKGFLGFTKLTATDKVKNLETITQYDYNTSYFNTFIKQQKVRTTSGNDISSATYTNAVKHYGSKRIFPYVSDISEKNHLTDITISTNQVFDTDNGNLTKETAKAGTDVTTVTSYTYVHAGGNGLTNKVQTINSSKTYKDQPAFSRKQEFSYNTKGILIKKTDWTNNTSNQVITEYLNINSLGLAEKITEKAGSLATLTTLFQYDNKGRLIKTTNPLGLSTTNTYNSKGYLTSVTDALGNSSYYLYDGWGKIRQSTTPTGVVTTETTEWSTNNTNDTDRPTLGLYKITKKTTNVPASVVYYDALGYKLRNIYENIHGKKLYVNIDYNIKGEVTKTTRPSFNKNSTEGPSFSYDEYGRITEQEDFNGMTGISYTYDKLTTTSTNKAGQKQTRKFNAAGDVISSKDNQNNEVTYVYHSSGQPLIVNAGETATTISYDLYGRQISLSDPSAGRKTFQYNADGSLAKETDANGKITTFEYDNYGRITKKIHPEFTVSYTYNSKGQLTAETASNGISTHYTYDAYGRSLTYKESIVDGKSFEKRYAYANGKISSITYSDENGKIATENYIYKNGYLYQIKFNNSDIVWQLNDENEKGQPTNAKTGNYTRTYEYDEYGFPATRKIANSNNSLSQHYTYTFDPKTGNLEEREDKIYNRTETFSYDNLNRLTTWTSNNSAGNALRTNSTTYDNKGNIKTKTDIGTFRYELAAKPYTLTKIENNKNGIPSRDQQIKYNSFMRPVSIVENEYAADFTYNAHGERVRTNITHKNAPFLKRYYMGGNYEVEIKPGQTTKCLYLGGDAYSAPAAYVFSGNPGGWRLCYLFRDYQGSITKIITADGYAIQTRSFDPWGRLRNNNTHAEYAPDQEPSLQLGRGYTGHEHLPMFGLINMNARLYDPALGRFLSPDPYVQMPEYAQNFNRYSYALNNPLLYTDESGELIQFIVMGAMMNIMMQGMAGNLNSGWDFLKAAAIGGAAGAAGGLAGGLSGTLGGFYGGTMSGAASGFASASITGAGNAWMNGSGFVKGLKSGLTSGAYSALTGGIIGGLQTGISHHKRGYGFWDGKVTLEKKATEAMIQTQMSDDLFEEWNPDETLQYKIKNKFGAQKGDFGILDYTTKVPDDYDFDNYNGLYKNKTTGNYVAGIYRKSANSSRGTMYISLGVLSGDDIVFFETVGHEFVHAYHYYSLDKVVKKYSENVAYKFSAKTYMENGRYESAMQSIRTGMEKGFLQVAPPKQYMIPSNYLFSIPSKLFYTVP